MGLFFRKSSIYNVRMVITEEKILSNIDKIKRLIDPDSKKQIIKLEDDMYFKDLVESVTTYLINYPNKEEFPFNVYKTAYDLVEFTTNQFEENNKKIASLIDLREENIKQSYLLQDALATVIEKKAGWIDKVQGFEGKFSVDIAEALTVIANSSINDEKDVENAKKMVETKIKNLESNLFIEVDLDRIEDSSKALSFIGIEIAGALKTIPIPSEGDSKKKIENNGGIFSFFKKNDKKEKVEEEKKQAEINEVNNTDLNIKLNEKKEEDLSSINEFSNINKSFSLDGVDLKENNPNEFGFEIVNLQNENVNELNNEINYTNNLNTIISGSTEFNSFYDPSYQNNYEINNANFDFSSLNMPNVPNYNTELQSSGDFSQNAQSFSNDFLDNTRKEVKLNFFQNLINKIKNSKFGRWINYLFNVQVVLDYPEYPIDK